MGVLAQTYICVSHVWMLEEGIRAPETGVVEACEVSRKY